MDKLEIKRALLYNKPSILESDQQWKPMFFRTELIFTGFVR